MKSVFSIGEMAKIHNVSIKTLRYYDKIDLFKPINVDEESGYRYYSYKQFESLNTILYLKYIGISLKEIKGYMAIRSKTDFLKMLEHEHRIIRDKIATLERMDQSIRNQIHEVKETYAIKRYGEIEVKELENRDIIVVDEKIETVLDLEMSLHKLKGMLEEAHPIVIGSVGVLMSQKNLLANCYDYYSSVCIFMNQHINAVVHRIVPKGKYACLYYQGNNHEASPLYYKKIMSYIHKKGYKVIGDAVERVIINEYKSNKESEFLTEIQIPIDIN